MTFTLHSEPYQRADDVGYAVTEFLWFDGKPFYPIGALADARIAALRLSAGAFDEGDEDNLDLIFQMREAGGGHFFEVVLRSNSGTSYAGWLWGQELEVLNEVAANHRVLLVECNGSKIRYAYNDEKGRYMCDGPDGKPKLSFRHAIKRLSAG
ncbi:hypothetical protein [Rhizobium sp. 18065]|uniref:hypothetical protein n=1 Tax=Rhizobium sp. 18065 TaxID=2681411 RepID=UPI001356D06E|nr:hypothetical protein [Rhizobium sp. 18065]